MDNNTMNGVAGLKKHKISTTGIVFTIYCLVAAGAFGIEEMIPASGPGMTILMLLLFPLLWALPISEMVAELGAVLPSEGGVYVWCKEAFGEFWGWQVGFWGTLGTWLSQATYVVLVVGYMGKFIDMTPVISYTIKIAIIVIFTIINLFGIKEVSQVSTVLSILVLIGFSTVAIVGFAHWNHNPVTPFIPEGQGVVESLGASICLAVWMFCGYECMANVAGEIENPQVIPKGLIIAMPLIAVSYLLPTVAGLAAVGQWQNWATEGERAVSYMDVLTDYLGPAFGGAFLVIAILSQCSIFNAYIASGSRGFFVMADDHLFPPFLVKVSKNRGVPCVSIVVMALFTITLCQLDFSTLVMATTPLMFYLYMALGIAIRRLRKTYPVEERKEKGLFVIPGGKLGLNYMSVLPFIISIIGLYINGTEYFLSGYILLIISLLGYVICKIRYGGLTKVDPKAYPINPKTKLAEGDLKNIGIYVILCGVSAIAGRIFLNLYEGDWGAEYYLEEYGEGLFSDFSGMLDLLLRGGLITLIIGVIVLLCSRKLEKNYLIAENRNKNIA